MAYRGIDSLFLMLAMRTLQPAVDIKAATNRGIVYLCLIGCLREYSIEM